MGKVVRAAVNLYFSASFTPPPLHSRSRTGINDPCNTEFGSYNLKKGGQLVAPLYRVAIPKVRIGKKPSRTLKSLSENGWKSRRKNPGLRVWRKISLLYEPWRQVPKKKIAADMERSYSAC